ncbi:MAG: NADPH-Fe(3+) oxidoreductase subunit beta [Chloroflexi bacterium]|nr:NADPH-Fe(3+) oxidoreductase subunit beta [Chloroflexota bacterium]
MTLKTGVYICHCGSNIARTVDVKQVTEYNATLDSVEVARDYLYMCSDLGQELIKNDIKELGLDRVVVASCSPRMHELTFRKACVEGGLNPYLYTHANIREHCSWVHRNGDLATEKAKDLIRASVRRVCHQEPLEVKEVPVNPNTLIVGGGIAGITAALKIAASENRVYLVEREPSIGGRMSQLNMTFPTLDCSECILTPKMTDVGNNPYIDLMASSEIEEVSGYVGNFKVKIRKKARFVTEKCTACGDCIKECPVEVLSEFEEGLNKRKAIYIPFAQSIPNKYVISRNDTPPCKLACPIGMDIQGYLALVSVGKFQEAYQLLRRTNPLPSVCGRVCYHPCEDACKRAYVDEPLAINPLKRFITDGVNVEQIELPQITPNGHSVAVIGSGPAGLAAAHDLALWGYSVTIFEALSEGGGMLRAGIPEYRLPRDVLRKDIEYIQKLGVVIKTDTRIGEQVTLDDLEHDHQAVFVAVGAHQSLRLKIPGEETLEVIPGVDFLRAVNMDQKVEVPDRVVVIGGGNTAIDCARVARRLGAAEVHIICLESRDDMPAGSDEIEQAEAEGILIHHSHSVTRIVSDDGHINGVECLDVRSFEFDEEGGVSIDTVRGSEHIVPAGAVILAIGQHPDIPRQFGLSLGRGNTIQVSPDTLSTSRDGVFAGGDVVTGPAKVIEAIAAGKRAARSIDSYLKGEILEIKERPAPERLGDEEIAELQKLHPIQKRVDMPQLAPAQRIGDFAEVEQGYTIGQAQEEAARCLACGGCCDCLECEKVCEPKAIDHSMKDEVVEIEVGSIIVATGYDDFDPGVISEYGYGKYDNVITALEFERLSCAAGPTSGEILLKDGRKPESVAIIHCVGSRDQNYHEYCSRVCCMYALKDAYLIREHTGAEVYQMYIDMRCFGEGYEEFYKRLSEKGVHFIRGKASAVTDHALAEEEKGRLIVTCEDTLIGSMLRVPVDMVILCIALEPRSDAEQVARLFNISRRPDGFFQERHLKLDPIATPTSGVFVIGCCGGPRDISDTVAQALGGAGEALAMIGKGSVTLEAAVAAVSADICIGCGRCTEVCEFHSPEVIKDERGMPVCQVNEVVCQGCGACGVACPTGAMSIRHFTDEQILSTVDALVEV